MPAARTAGKLEFTIKKSCQNCALRIVRIDPNLRGGLIAGFGFGCFRKFFRKQDPSASSLLPLLSLTLKMRKRLGGNGRPLAAGQVAAVKVLTGTRFSASWPQNRRGT
jgi:hypothetical protein